MATESPWWRRWWCAERNFGWFCEIDGKRVFWATLQIAPGFVMPVDGTRGPMELTAGAVADLNLSRRHP